MMTVEQLKTLNEANGRRLFKTALRYRIEQCPIRVSPVIFLDCSQYGAPEWTVFISN